MWGFVFAGPAFCSEISRLNEEGLKYLDEKDYASAVSAFESAGDMGPENAAIKKNLGIAYHYRANEMAAKYSWVDAIRYEKKADAIDPSSLVYRAQTAVYYNNYALALFKKGRYDLARMNFAEALRLDYENDTIRENLYNVTLEAAKSASSSGRLQEALNLGNDCIVQAPSNPNAYLFLGNMSYEQNHLEKTLAYWKRALTLDPANEGLKQDIKRERNLLQHLLFTLFIIYFFPLVSNFERNSHILLKP